jgi:hypothetical protein
MSHQSELLALHGRLIAGDLRAAHHLVELSIAQLKGIVSKDVSLPDAQDVEQACFDALFEYLQNPTSYDPRRSQLVTYLAAIAKGKAKTTQRSNARRLARDMKYLDEQALETPVLQELDLGELDQVVRAELVKEAGDDVLLDLIARGIDEAPEVARTLNLPSDVSGHQEAKRRMERMRGRLRRLKDKIGAQ